MKKAGMLILFLFILFLNESGQAQTSLELVNDLSSGKFIEFAPAISGDGTYMVFQLQRKNRWWLYESKLQPDGSWSEPVSLEEINQKFEYVAGPSLSYDGSGLYFTAYQEDAESVVVSEDIFYTRRSHGIWEEPVNLGKPVNTFMYEGFPSISADESTLYFMRENPDYPFDKDDKVHCFKLYRSIKNLMGKWQEPEELPYPVNFNCERSPKILPDNKTLMFSSIRADGQGKFDVYQSKLQPNGMWTEPIPVSYINTANNDQSPCISGNGEVIYFYNDGDIYRTNIPSDRRAFDKIQLNGRVIDAVYKVGLSVNIEIVNPYSGKVIDHLDNTESDGKFKIDLLKGLIYDFNIIQDNNFTYTFPLDLTDLESQTEITLDFELFSNLNLKMDVVDQKSQLPIPQDLKVMIRMDKTQRQDIYLLKFNVENFREASTFLDLNEVRKDPDFRKKIELSPL
ncbi:MAG: TolB family protein [Candidatus Cyclobacteriaceae bacterium M3_2C_046]